MRETKPGLTTGPKVTPTLKHQQQSPMAENLRDGVIEESKHEDLG
jgi:hypothetical protein